MDQIKDCPVNISVSESVIETWDWKSGSVEAREIVAKIDKNLYDCSQFRSSGKLCLSVHGNAYVMSKSIWNPGPIIVLDVHKTFHVKTASQMKTICIDLLKAKNLLNEGLVVTVSGSRVLCEDCFDNKHIWIALQDSNTQVITGWMKQGNQALIKSEGFIGISIEENVTEGWNGVILARNLCIEVKKTVICNAKCAISEDVTFAHVVSSCVSCQPPGHVKVTNEIRAERKFRVLPIIEDSLCGHSKVKYLSSIESPALTVSTVLTCRGFEADSSSCHFMSNSSVIVNPMENANKALSCLASFGALKTFPESEMAFGSCQLVRFIITKEWHHLGKVVVRSPAAFFCVNKMTNQGVIEGLDNVKFQVVTSIKNNSNLHSSKRFIIEGGVVQNNSKIASDQIEMNINRIFQSSFGSFFAKVLLFIAIRD